MAEQFRDLPENRCPLNQHCRKALLALDHYDDPAYLYSLQLAIWGLENLPTSGPSRKYQSELLQQAEVMLGWPAKNSQPLLMPLASEGDFKADENWVTSDDPEMVAAELATILIENLQADFPQLGPPLEAD